MSKIGKPIINNIIDSLSTEQLKTLLSKINSPKVDYSVDKVSALTSQLSIYRIKAFTGILVSTYFITFNLQSQRLILTELDKPNDKLINTNENLSVEELRRLLGDKLIEAGEVSDYVTEEELSEKAATIIETENIAGLSKAQLDSLKPGDIVNKITGNEKHSYHVSYKGEGAGQGICLTYCDASVVETISYDRSGDDWVYNSTDVSEVKNVVANPTLQLGHNYNLLERIQIDTTKYFLTVLYRHHIIISDANFYAEFYMIDSKGRTLSTESNFEYAVGKDCLSISAEMASDEWLSLPYMISFVASTRTLKIYLDSTTIKTYTLANDTVISDEIIKLQPGL